jgi:hypothetical protein
MLVRIVAVLILLSMAVGAAPQLTTIQDMIFKADGTRFNGLAQIAWSTFTSGGSNVGQQTRVVRIVDGHLYVQLAPTTNAIPAARYTVKYNSDGRLQYTEFWQVPLSSTPLKIKDVRTGDPIFPGAGSQTLIPESDVIGLVQDLAARPVRGPGFGNDRVAVINSNGEVEGAVGSLADCVHVDGSSGTCGGSGSAPAFVDAETPAGTINGTNAVFTLAQSPNPGSSLSIYRNGLLQKLTTDYTVSSNAITFVTASRPQTGDILTAFYRVPGGTSTPIFSDQETPLGTINGVNAVFTIGAAPSPVASLMIFRNGVLKRQGIDYTVSSATVTFVAGQIPQTGDSLTANYRR